MATRQPAATSVGVLDKAMTVLLTFSRNSRALTPQDIALRTGLALPTVYRLTQALVAHGLLEKDGQRFRLGLELLRLGALVAESLDLRREVLPALRWLNQLTGENAELYIRQGDHRLSIEAVLSAQNLRPIVNLGEPLPLHAGAAGKVLLAWLPADEREHLAQLSAQRFPEIPLDLSLLRAQLEEVRRHGWYASESERATGLGALASPIFSMSGMVVGALTLVAPASRLGIHEIAAYVPLIGEAAERASRALGYVGAFPREEGAVATHDSGM